MAQNTSSAVMQQRAEPHDSLDDFPTPPWATRALCEQIIWPGAGQMPIRNASAWDPACNRGYMVRPLREYFGTVHASDIHDYGGDHWLADFLYPTSFPNGRFDAPDWIVTNPPFRLAEQFIERAQDIAVLGVAMIVRSAFLEGVGRYQRLFSDNPPNVIAQFTERVIMTKGVVRDPALSYWDEAAQKHKRPSTATAYCWLVWKAGTVGTEFEWISPCRRLLERPGDYEAAE